MVMATDVSEESLRAVSRTDGWSRLTCEGKNASGVLLLPLDVRDPASWEIALSAAGNAWGGLDTVLNFAGLLEPKSAFEITPRSIDLHVDVMIKGVMHGTAAAARAFAVQRVVAHDGLGGHVVNVSSLGAVAPVAGVSLYQAAKAGCRTFSLAAAKDLASHNVVVSVLMPDAVATPMAELQLYQDESAMAYSGGILTLEQLTGCVLEHVLAKRPMEARLGADYVRQWGAGVADAFPSSRAVAWTEAGMRSKGRTRQARECARRLAAGGLSEEERRRLMVRLQELGGGGGGGGGRRWWRVVAALLVGWALILRVGACAGASDFAKATLGWPAHRIAADLAVSLAKGGEGDRRASRQRVAMVTGATSGIGRETAAALAEAGYHVFMGARSPMLAVEAVAEVSTRARRRGLGGTAEAVSIDLSSVGSVKRAVEEVRVRSRGVLHVLVCSAGVMPSPLAGQRELTSDGVEKVWAVNHLGHFALAQGLHSALRRGAQGRDGHGQGLGGGRLVVVTSEHGHKHFGSSGLGRWIEGDEAWSAFRAYGVSKLSNVLHAMEAGRRWWPTDGVAGIAVHPGIVPTRLGQTRDDDGVGVWLHNVGVWLWWHIIARPVAESVEMGAASVIYGALSPELAGRPFAYVVHCREAEVGAAAKNTSAAEWLWRESARMVRG